MSQTPVRLKADATNALHAIIDDTARRMTSAPAPATRARVLAQLGHQRRRPAWLVPAGAVAAAACVALAFGIRHSALGTRHSETGTGHWALGTGKAAEIQEPPSGHQAARTSRTEDRGRNWKASVPEGVAPASARSPVPGAGSPVPSTGPPSAERRAPSADQLAWHAAAIPPLDRPDPLVLDSIQPDTLEVRPLDIAPLEIPVIGEEDEE